MKKGFTLMELLIVIAILGILAAALLATIDPLEQFKKARDSNSRNTSVEIYNAIIRYNANRGYMPWVTEGAPGCTVLSVSFGPTVIGAANAMGCINALVSEGELKAGFTTSINPYTNKIYLRGDSDIVVVGFKPESKAVRGDTATKYSSDLTTGNCTPSYTNTNCWWAAQ